LNSDVPKGAVVFSDDETSYRIAAVAPVYVAAALPGHVADTKANRPYARRADAREFFRTGRLAIPRRYGAQFVLVNRRRSKLRLRIEPVELSRSVHLRIGRPPRSSAREGRAADDQRPLLCADQLVPDTNRAQVWLQARKCAAYQHNPTMVTDRPRGGSNEGEAWHGRRDPDGGLLPAALRACSAWRAALPRLVCRHRASGSHATPWPRGAACSSGVAQRRHGRVGAHVAGRGSQTGATAQAECAEALLSEVPRQPLASQPAS